MTGLGRATLPIAILALGCSYDWERFEPREDAVDASSRVDASDRIDAGGGTDSGPPRDSGAGEDAGSMLDSSVGLDAPMGEDGGAVDSGGGDAGPDLRAGLVAHFTFDVTSDAAMAIDLVSGEAIGFVMGAVRVPGRAGAGMAMQFDGIDDEVDISTGTRFTLSTQYTLSVWVSVDTLNNDFLGCRLESRSALGSRDTGALDFTAYAAGSSDWPMYNTRSTDRIAPDATWHHVAAVADGSDIQLYVDGVPQPPLTLSAGTRTDTTTRFCYLGSNGGSGPRFAGRLDDVRIYDRALTSVTIAALAE